MGVPEEQGLSDPSLAVLEQRIHQEMQRRMRVVRHAMSAMLTKANECIRRRGNRCAENIFFKTVIYLLYVIPDLPVRLFDKNFMPVTQMMQ